MYLTPTEQHWSCDIEADNLLDEATRIHCVCLENILTGEKLSFTNAEDFIKWEKSFPTASVLFVGHNFLAYDLVMLNRHWKAGIGVSRVVDTFVLSQLYNPTYHRPKGLTNKKSVHSLEAWGIRLRFPKTGHADFSTYTPEMLEYCQNDTALTALLFRKLSARMREVGFSEEGCELEHLAWHIIQNKQRRNGFPFNSRKAEELYVELLARAEGLERDIYGLWPPQLQCVGEFKNAYRKDGTPSVNFLRHSEQFPQIVVDAENNYRAIDYVSFNLGSSDQRIKKLLELGWVPSRHTKKTAKGGGGNPQVDEDELLAFAEVSGKKELIALAKWLVVSARARNVKTWLDAVKPDGAIHGSLFIAATLRYSHSSPNTANIPAVREYPKDHERAGEIAMGEDGAWAYECRDLFYVGEEPGWSLVGLDGTGIQNRCLIHGLIKTVGEERVRDFMELALRGDIHRHNIEVLGLAHKAAAKKFYYTLMMGGGGERLAADQAQFGTHMTPQEGANKKKRLVATIPGFGDLIKALQAQVRDTGRIILCDGTPILVPSPHMVIPYLLQGDESRIMKRTMIYIDREIRRHGWEKHVFKVADIHDEMQYRVRNEYVEAFRDTALPCFNRAGVSFGYLIPIDGDAKIGMTWARTH